MIENLRLWCWRAVLVCLGIWLVPMAHAATWEQPASDLARQIAALTGPGPARLVMQNASTLPAGDLPVIRRLLDQDLRRLGVLPGGKDSATLIRVTFSENLQGGLWVAEVQEGTETRVTMLAVPLAPAASSGNGGTITIRRTLLIAEDAPVLDAKIFVTGGVQRLVVLEPERIVTYERNAAALGSGTWIQDQSFAVTHTRPYPRDLRGELVSATDHAFDAWLPGVTCRAAEAGAGVGTALSVTCADSDDPWPVGAGQKGFYNAMRDNFTGVLAPGFGMDLPPFYEAGEVPHETGAAMLLALVDGRVLLMDSGVAKPVTGTNDWGSDFAVLRSGCGSGAQVLVSGSGAAAAGDSLRAWEIAGREAIPVSAPLSVDGVVTAIWPSEDGASATVIVRRESPLRYEVWNGSALCN
ncbi:MAG TPA: hypothetical protein VFE06_18675 [Acidobacteriaceae bacterium]|jgi:hypothetical protein|nr:hypothetical protein [Acidobacteriaceae bacterium]